MPLRAPIRTRSESRGPTHRNACRADVVRCTLARSRVPPARQQQEFECRPATHGPDGFQEAIDRVSSHAPRILPATEEAAVVVAAGVAPVHPRAVPRSAWVPSRG